MRPSQNLPLPSRYNLFSTNVYVRPPPPSQNLPLPPRICPPFNNYMRSSQNLPLPPRYTIFSTNVYVRPPPPPPHRIYPSLQEYAPFQQLYAILPESTPPSRNIYTPPLFNNTPLFNNYMRRSQNLPLLPRIYRLFQQMYICDPLRIYSSLQEYTPPPPSFDTYIRFFLVMLNNNLQTRQKPRSKISDI